MVQSINVKTIDTVIKEYFLEEKILICPNFETGNQILTNLAQSGFSWINFKVKIIQFIADEIAEPEIYKRKLKKISNLEVKFLIDNIFTRLSKEGKFKYFKKHTINSGIINSLSNVIIELKFAGIISSHLKNGYFICQNKAKDLKLVFSEYEAALKDKSLIDSADIINLAQKNLGSVNKKIKYLILSGYDYSDIEKKFLEKLCKHNLILIEKKPVYKLTKPKKRLGTKNISQINNHKPGKFSWLFDIENMPESTIDIDIDIFSGKIYKNEIYEILQRLANSNICLDETEIVYTASNPYLDTIYNLCQKLGLQVTFSEGLSGDKCLPGMSLKGFLIWIKEDFIEIHLRRLLKYNLIKLPKSISNSSAVNSQKLAHILRISGIGWGRGRYKLITEKKISELTKKIEEDAHNRNNYGNQIKLYKALGKLTKKLLNIVPDIDEGKVDFKKLCEGCLKFILNFIEPANEEETSYLEKLKDNIKSIAYIVDNIVPLEEAVDKIIELLSSIKYGKAGPKPSHLYVSNLAYGGISGRSNTYIVGMDEYNFSGKKVQDPVLLDEEREKISDNLKLSCDRPKDRLFDFTSMLSSLRGMVTFSYSIYDIKDDKDLYPSPVLLQIYRLKSAKINIDYEDLFSFLDKPSGFGLKSSGIFIDENSWWLNKIMGGDTLKDAKSSVLKIYPWLKKGDIAARSRNSNKLTFYDGLINPTGEELDPRKNKNFILSCSAIESYANCPYAFFLEYILEAKRPVETIKDLSRWLDEGQRGGLLHEVFKLFSKKLKDTKECPDIKEQKKIINKILDKVIEKYIEKVPIPSRAIFSHEVELLRRDIAVFLDINSQLENPYFLEFEFGYKGKDPVKICIAKNTYIYVKGKIDRIDITETGECHVWDYKTGSAYSYNHDEYISAGKQVQHILYARAAEEILKKIKPDIKVTRCGYILPTEKGASSGKGCIFVRDPFADSKWQEALNCLFDLIKSGVFIISEEDNPSYLDDTDIYGDSEIKNKIKEKIKNTENRLLVKWQKLKEFK